MSLIVALDFSDLGSCKRILKDLSGLVKIYKIGSELFTAHGWRAVDLVKEEGAEVFLDLKLHDIPTTVAKTARIVCERNVFMFNVHALGGFEMMVQARKAMQEFKERPILVAVTILTHLQEQTLSEELGIEKSLSEEVLSLARLASRAGLDGVVCSPQEIGLLRRELGTEFILVTPGIRPTDKDKHEQRRSLTPKEALERGSDYLVIGRPITEAADPQRVVREILTSIS